MPPSKVNSKARLKFISHDLLPAYSSRISPLQWSFNEDFIRALHESKVTREQILTALREHMSFRPSMNQLNAQMKIWGLRVYRTSLNTETATESEPTEKANEAVSTSSSSRRWLTDSTPCISPEVAAFENQMKVQTILNELIAVFRTSNTPSLNDAVDNSKRIVCTKRAVAKDLPCEFTNKENINLPKEAQMKSYRNKKAAHKRDRTPFRVHHFDRRLDAAESSAVTISGVSFLEPYRNRRPLSGGLYLVNVEDVPESTQSPKSLFIPVGESTSESKLSLSVREHDRILFQKPSQKSERSMFSLATRLKKDLTGIPVKAKPSVSTLGISVSASGSSWSLRRLTGFSPGLNFVDHMELDG